MCIIQHFYEGLLCTIHILNRIKSAKKQADNVVLLFCLSHRFHGFHRFCLYAPVLTIRVISAFRGFLTSSPFLSHRFHRFHRYCLYSPILTIRVISVIRVTTSHPLSLLPPLSPWRGAGGEAFLPLPLERGWG